MAQSPWSYEPNRGSRRALASVFRASVGRWRDNHETQSREGVQEYPDAVSAFCSFSATTAALLERPVEASDP